MYWKFMPQIPASAVETPKSDAHAASCLVVSACSIVTMARLACTAVQSVSRRVSMLALMRRR